MNANSRYSLPIFATVQEAWQKNKGAKKTLWGAYGWILLIAILLGITIGIFEGIAAPGAHLIVRLLKALTGPLTSLLTMGVLGLAIYRALDLPIKASMVFKPLTDFGLLLRLFGYWLLYVLALLPCFIIIFFTMIFAFPAETLPFSTTNFVAIAIIAILTFAMLYLTIRFRMGWGFIFDKGSNSWEALCHSIVATRNNFWPLMGLIMVNWLILMISAIPLGIGLIWTFPYTLVSYGVAYRKLKENNF